MLVQTYKLCLQTIQQFITTTKYKGRSLPVLGWPEVLIFRTHFQIRHLLDTFYLLNVPLLLITSAPKTCKPNYVIAIMRPLQIEQPSKTTQHLQTARVDKDPSETE